MTLFDLILILIVFGFVWFGFWFGLVHAFGGLVGLIVGASVASRYYDDLGKKILFIFGNRVNLANIFSFLIIYIVANRLVGFVFFIIDRIFRPITQLPFLKTINRLGGAIFGFFEGVLTVGLFLYFLTKNPIDWLIPLIEKSKITWYFLKLVNLLMPFLPEVFKKIESVIKIPF